MQRSTPHPASEARLTPPTQSVETPTLRMSRYRLLILTVKQNSIERVLTIGNGGTIPIVVGRSSFTESGKRLSRPGRERDRRRDPGMTRAALGHRHRGMD